MLSMEIQGNVHSSTSARKLLVTCKVLGITVRVVDTNTEGSCLVTLEGNILPPSAALRHLVRLRPGHHLYGRTLEEMALVDKWLSDIEFHYTLPITGVKAGGHAKGNQNKLVAAMLHHMKETLDPMLLTQTFIVGHRMTIADIDLALSLQEAVNLKFFDIAEMSSKYVSVYRWLTLMLNQPAVLALPQMTKLSSEHTKPAASQKKAEPKADSSVKKGVAEGKDEDSDNARPKKKSNALDDLPPSPFIMDEWKRQYSNCKDLKNIAMPWFWERFDPAGWSLWYVRYDKLEGENTLGYTTANMLNGFLQRIDPAFRQYSFAVMNVVGAQGHFEIQGVWLIRGQQIPFELEDHPSYEYYEFRQLHPLDDVEHKTLIEEYWCNNDVVEGHPIDSCKVWK